MRKSIRIFAMAATTLLLTACLALALVACDPSGNTEPTNPNDPNGPNEPASHSHAWSQSWDKDDTHHWHNCTKEDCTLSDNSQKDGYAPHDFTNGDCVCGKEAPVVYTTGLTYTLNSDNASYSVTGIGEATDTNIIIPAHHEDGKPVTEISAYAFSNQSSIESVVIPSGVTRISMATFLGCTSLKNITIPASVTNIGTSAFNGCSSLESIEIPSGVSAISDGTFSGCTALETVSIPSSVTSIGWAAFSGCSELTEIEFKGTVSQWTQITKQSTWKDNSGNFTVRCTNGTLDKDGNEI